MQPPTSVPFYCVIFTDSLSVLKNSYKCFSIMVGFDTDTPGCLKNHHTLWKVCYYISQPSALLLMPAVHPHQALKDTGQCSPWPASRVKSRNSPSAPLSHARGLAESIHMRLQSRNELKTICNLSNSS